LLDSSQFSNRCLQKLKGKTDASSDEEDDRVEDEKAKRKTEKQFKVEKIIHFKETL
jgi:hypothetical protein